MLPVLLLVAGTAAAQICGDANGDGAVTDLDAVLALRRAANLPSPCKEIVCDADGDHTITDADGVRILHKAARLPIVERCGRGGVSGTILIGDAGRLQELEREPNDVAALAGLLGRVGAGDTRRRVGRVDAASDPFDGYVLLCDAPLTLDLRLRAAGHDADLDLLVVDPASGEALGCESAARGRESCRLAFDPDGDAAALHVVVAAAEGTADYALTIRARRGVATEHRLAAGAGAGPPAAIAARVYRGVEADFVPGELIVQRAGGGSQARATARVADALVAAGMATEWRPATVSPSGATLYVHTAVADAAGADTRSTAKAARALLRARTHAAAAELARRASTDPAVAFVQPNYIARPARVPNDPLFARQWHYRLLGLPQAWDLTTGSDDVVVAVVDTGVRSDHPDLTGRLVPGYDFISERRRANDGDGRDADPFDPGDLPGSSVLGSFHGTHVTGTIAAATANGRGVAGVTWQTRVMPLRVLGVGGGTSLDIAEAIRFAAGLENASGRLPAVPAAIINLSLVAFGDDPLMRAAVDAATEAGALVVAAAGNTGSDVVVSPASFANTLSVAATDALGAPAPYSAFGGTIDLSAPGGDTTVDLNADGIVDGVLSTVLPGSRDYENFQGTSMAAAHVSGIAALMLARGGAAAPGTLRAALLATAHDRGAPGRDDRYGFGMVDAAAAIRAFAGLPAPTEPVLALDSDAVAFGTTRTVLTVHARNGGGGILTLAPPIAAAADELGWLAARLDEGATGVTLTADRRLLPPGAYAGTVTVPSNAGTAAIAVSLEVATRPAADVGPVTVELRDPAGGAATASTTTTFAAGYAFDLQGVRGGTYELRAGTDRDRDGAICDLGELCGAYPVLTAPRSVTIVGGQSLPERDFVLVTVTNEP